MTENTQPRNAYRLTIDGKDITTRVRPILSSLTISDRQRGEADELQIVLDDHDGKIDTWDLLNESGQVVRRAHDSNGDGRVDQAWTFDPERRGCAAIAADENADGKADLGEAFDICKSLGAKNAPAAKGDAGAPVTR